MFFLIKNKYKTYKITYTCYSIKNIKNKGIFLVGGKDNNYNHNIYIYRSGDFSLIQTIENAHSSQINGFIELNDKLVLHILMMGKLKFSHFKII